MGAKVRLALLVVVLPLLLAASLAAAPLATTSGGGAAVQWQIAVEHRAATLTVTQPDGRVVRLHGDAGAAGPVLSIFDDAGQMRPEGVYHWELRLDPVVPAAVARELAAARAAGDDETIARLQAAAGLDHDLVASGSLSLRDGAFVTAGAREPASPAARQRAGAAKDGPAKDVVNADDMIIQGSLCVGLDCVNNESFGFDTIRLKENNTRIKFDDTSTSAGYPSNDWQLTANDSASGGANKFSIDDVTSGRTPFTILAGAPNNSLFVASTGKAGFGTSNPLLNLHITSTDTPAIRQEQTNGGGFTAQTWDIGGNEVNWFVRDVTGGSRLPFRIRPGAPTSSIDIAASGNVGIGTASPGARLHVSGNDGNTREVITESSTTAAARTLLQLANNGDAKLNFTSTAAGATWELIGGSTFVVNRGGSGVNEMIVNSGGNVTIAGTLTQNSDRNTKTDIVPVDSAEVLNKVMSLPLATWRKIGDSATHLGPMAQDFAAAFSLGDDNRHVAPIDVAGVSLAAIQGLQAEVAARDQRIATLESRLAALEAMVKKLGQQQ